MRKEISLLLLTVFGTPLISIVGCVPDYMIAADQVPSHIVNAAYDDARSDSKVGTCLWLSGSFGLGIGGGCLLGSLSIVAARFYEPSPPSARLVGKPPEYIDAYIEVYKGVRNDAALSAAFIGCTSGAVVAGCFVTPWSTVLGTVVGKIAYENRW